VRADTHGGREIPPSARGRVVDDQRFDTALPLAQELIMRHGVFDGVVGLSELPRSGAASRGVVREIEIGAACLDALDLDDGPFHLERFKRAPGESAFLEVGPRSGGAEVPFIHRDLFGIDLLGEAFRTMVAMPLLSPTPLAWYACAV
jgi:hypothetical protein